MKFYYMIDEQIYGPLDTDIKILDRCSTKILAERCAEHNHFQCNGWEREWPMDITLLHEDRSVIGTFEVDRDVVPEFYAVRKPVVPEGK